ncbi:SPOR domain-containing protein [uncultured Rhodoferax sp.]|uniref:SPOR domain-containing protein n=1 Tax=uncultured Rhodoferax sp. TaxID=223188 RepID=UPI0025FA5CED|nr:SPOR domain-containing protein [uncultured Rhodoferax sp.]
MTSVPRFVPSARLVGMALLSTALLSGCAIWPKSWTFWGNSEPVPAEAATPAAPAQPETAQTPLAEPVIVSSTPVAEPVKPEVAPVASLPPEAPKPTAAPAAPAKSAGPVKMEKGFYINVGLFAVPSNASNAFQKLEKAGLPAYTELLETNVGKLTRVRVGGFPTKVKADAAAKKIKGLQLEAIVFRHK